MSDLQDLTITKVFDAPLEAVWNAWKDPEMFKKWWGPDFFDCPTANIDFREGGMSLVSMVSSKFGIPEQFSRFDYQKIVPMERIEYIHNLSDKDGNKVDPAAIGMPADFPKEQLHIITFKDLGDGKTEVTVVEQNWPAGQMRQMSQMGMNQCLDKMAKAVEEK